MKKLALKSCFFTALLLLTVCVRAQSVKGKVVDATTGNPIPSASIYLNGSSKGTTSDAQGEFILNTTETNIPLVVSSVGYQSEVINNYSNKTLSVKLSPRVQVLREVVIGGMSREEQMKIFLTQFIGSISKDCFIENLDDINFFYSKKSSTLEADVSQPLIIYNKKLGYKITYFLSSFSHSPIETGYSGNYVFEEDIVGLKPAELKRILKERDKVYFGSRMHFIRSLLANDLKNNKITIGGRSVINSKDDTLYKLVVKERNGEFFLSFPNNLSVKVRDGKRSLFMSPQLAIVYKGNESFITPQKNGEDVLITSNGYHTANLVWSGKMSEQRVSALLPYEFEPLEPLSKTDK